MGTKYLMVSFEDERIKQISEVLGNKTCKKIIDFLSENKEVSEKDMSDALKMPINTVEYNLKKLLAAGLIEKAKNFFWSRKGRKIDLYKLANKHIIISPKSYSGVSGKLKKIIPGVIVSGIGAVLIKIFTTARGGGDFLAEKFMDSAAEVVPTNSGAVGGMGAESFGLIGIPVWAWFLAGSLVALMVFVIWNWRKM